MYDATGCRGRHRSTAAPLSMRCSRGPMELNTVSSALVPPSRQAGPPVRGRDDEAGQVLTAVAGRLQAGKIAVVVELEEPQVGKVGVELAGAEGRLEALARLAPYRGHVDHHPTSVVLGVGHGPPHHLVDGAGARGHQLGPQSQSGAPLGGGRLASASQEGEGEDEESGERVHEKPRQFSPFQDEVLAPDGAVPEYPVERVPVTAP